MPNLVPSFENGSTSSITSFQKKSFRESQEVRKSEVPEGPHRSQQNPNSFIGGRSPHASRYASRKTEEPSFTLSKSSKDGRSFASFREDTRDSRTHERSLHSERRSKRSKKSDKSRDSHDKDKSDGSQGTKRPSDDKESSKTTQSASFTWGSEPGTPVTPKIELKQDIEEASKHKKGDSKAADSKAAASKTAVFKEQPKPSAPVQAPKRPINDFQRRITTLDKHRPIGYNENIPGMIRSPRCYAERIRQPHKVVEKPPARRTEIRLYPDLSKSQPGRLDCRTPCHIKDESDLSDNSAYPSDIINLRDTRHQTDSLRNIFVPEPSETSRRFTTSSMGSQFSDRYDNLRSPYRRTYDAEHHRYRNPPNSVVSIGQPDQRNFNQSRIPRLSQLREKLA